MTLRSRSSLVVRSIAGLRLFFRPEQEESADIVDAAARRSARLLEETWGLPTPWDGRLYLMTSWAQFLLDSAPVLWLPVYALTMPLWVLRIRKAWRYAGGWMQRYGRRPAVGVKPMALLAAADRSLGERIFKPHEDLTRKLTLVTCHELTHAFTVHLRLPAWLNEGLAMVTVDRYFGEDTVRTDTLERLGSTTGPPTSWWRQTVPFTDPDAAVLHYIRGYWLTRLLAEDHPETLTTLLARPRRPGQIRQSVAATFGLTPSEWWIRVDSLILSRFHSPAGAGPR